VPIYDYLCSNCRHLTEVIHGIHDPGPRFCPACGADGTMRKAMTTAAVHFKGSGWAKKDRSSASSARTKAGSASSTGGASSSTDSGSTDGGSTDGSSTDGSSAGAAAGSASTGPDKPSAKPAASSED
jgi:putative FmdB family regulatory protein